MTGARLTIEVDGLGAVRKSLGKLIAAGQPRCSSPTKSPRPTRTPSNTTRLCLSFAIVTSGVCDTPTPFGSTRNSDTPSQPSDASAVLTAVKHRPAA